MIGLDGLLVKARRVSLAGGPDEMVRISRRNLGLILGEVDRMRDQMRDIHLPSENAEGQKRSSGNDTQKSAALKVMPKSGTQRMEVLRAIYRNQEGLTDEQLADSLYYMSPNSIRPRRVELVTGEWIRDSGCRRRTSSDADAVVWVATEKTRAAFQRNQ